MAIIDMVFLIIFAMLLRQEFIPLKNIIRKKYFSIWLRRYLEILDIAFYIINSFVHSKRPLYLLENPKKRKKIDYLLKFKRKVRNSKVLFNIFFPIWRKISPDFFDVMFLNRYLENFYQEKKLHLFKLVVMMA